MLFLETFESQSIQFNISLYILGVYIIQALPKLQLVYFPIFRVIRDLHRFDDCLNGPGYVFHISGTALELEIPAAQSGLLFASKLLCYKLIEQTKTLFGSLL